MLAKGNSAHPPQAIGIGFPFAIENGQVKPTAVTYSPRDKDELN